MTENEIATVALDICFKIHRQYGPGLFESVYEEIIFYEWKKNRGFFSETTPVPLIHNEMKMGVGFRADGILDNKVIIE